MKSRKLVFNSFLVLTAAGFGLAAGFVLRREHQTTHSLNRTSISTNRAGPNKSGLQNKSHRFAADEDSPLAVKLEHDLAISTGVKRWLLWLEAIDKAAPADFPRLAKLAQGKPAAMRFLAARWVEVAPRHLFDTLVAAVRNGSANPVYELANALFDQWPKKDPEAAIAALNEPGDLGMRQLWRNRVAESIISTDAERGLRLMAEWHIENSGPRMGAITKWAAADPQHAAEFTSQNSLGYVAQLSMEAIGKEWARTDPPTALAFSGSHPGALGAALGSAALAQWASRDLDEAGAWLAGADTSTRNRLSPALMETWAKRDPAAALNWCQENLTGTSLAQGVSAVVKGVAGKDITRAAALVADMEPSPARSEAAIAAAQTLFPGLSSDSPVSPETVNWFLGLDADSCRRALDRVAWQWATSDPKTMTTFVTQAGPDKIPEFVDSVLARQLARKTPLEAIAWTSQLPERRGLDAGAVAFSEWRDSQPGSAMKWLAELPANDPRREPFFTTAIQNLTWHPQAIEQLAAMTETERSAAQRVIEGMNLPEDRRARLLAAIAKQ